MNNDVVALFLQGRDLSQVTDQLWFQFYEKKFGTRNTNDVVELMKTKNRKFLWKQLYKDKLKEQDERQKQSLERLTQSYKKEHERRQIGRVQICHKVPDSRKKRPFNEGIYSIGSFFLLFTLQYNASL